MKLNKIMFAKPIIIVLSIILLSTAANALPFTSVFTGGLLQINNFFSGRQYEPYAQAIDFFFFSLLFIAIYMMGARYAFKEVKRPEQVIVILLGLMTAFLLVLAGISAVILLPYIHWLFYVLLFILYWWMLKGIQNKFWRFVLALLLTILTIALIQGLFNTLRTPTTPSIGSVSVPSFSGIPGFGWLGGTGSFFKDLFGSFKGINFGVPSPGVPSWMKDLFGLPSIATPTGPSGLPGTSTPGGGSAGGGGVIPGTPPPPPSTWYKNPFLYIIPLLIALILLALWAGNRKKKEDEDDEGEEDEDEEKEIKLQDIIDEIMILVEIKKSILKKIKDIIEHKKRDVQDLYDRYHKVLKYDKAFWLDPDSDAFQQFIGQDEDIKKILKLEFELEKILVELMEKENEIVGIKKKKGKYQKWLKFVLNHGREKLREIYEEIKRIKESDPLILWDHIKRILPKIRDLLFIPTNTPELKDYDEAINNAINSLREMVDACFATRKAIAFYFMIGKENAKRESRWSKLINADELKKWYKNKNKWKEIDYSSPDTIKNHFQKEEEFFNKQFLPVIVNQLRHMYLLVRYLKYLDAKRESFTEMQELRVDITNPATGAKIELSKVQAENPATQIPRDAIIRVYTRLATGIGPFVLMCSVDGQAVREYFIRSAEEKDSIEFGLKNKRGEWHLSPSQKYFKLKTKQITKTEQDPHPEIQWLSNEFHDQNGERLTPGDHSIVFYLVSTVRAPENPETPIAQKWRDLKTINVHIAGAVVPPPTGTNRRLILKPLNSTPNSPIEVIGRYHLWAQALKFGKNSDTGNINDIHLIDTKVHPVAPGINVNQAILYFLNDPATHESKFYISKNLPLTQLKVNGIEVKGRDVSELDKGVVYKISINEYEFEAEVIDSTAPIPSQTDYVLRFPVVLRLGAPVPPPPTRMNTILILKPTNSTPERPLPGNKIEIINSYHNSLANALKFGKGHDTSVVNEIQLADTKIHPNAPNVNLTQALVHFQYDDITKEYNCYVSKNIPMTILKVNDVVVQLITASRLDLGIIYKIQINEYEFNAQVVKTNAPPPSLTDYESEFPIVLRLGVVPPPIEYPSGEYPPKIEYPTADYPKDEYPHSKKEYPRKLKSSSADYPKSEYPTSKTEYPPKEYPPVGEHPPYSYDDMKDISEGGALYNHYNFFRSRVTIQFQKKDYNTLRVLHLSIPRNIRAGVVTCVDNLVKYQANYGMNVELVTHWWNKDVYTIKSRKFIKGKKITTTRSPYKFTRIKTSIYAAKNIPDILKSNNFLPDVIHVHTHTFEYDGALRVLKDAFINAPVVYTLHQLIPHAYASSSEKKRLEEASDAEVSDIMFKYYSKGFEGRNIAQNETINNSDGIIAISNSQLEYFHKFFRRYVGQSTAIENGVDFFNYINNNKVEEKAFELLNNYKLWNQRLILFVGRIEEAKGYKRAIKAFLRILKESEFKNTRMIFIGGYIEDVHKLILKEGVSKDILKNNILITQWTSDPIELAAWYRIGTVLVNPMMTDNLYSMVAKEAICMGLPVIGCLGNMSVGQSKTEDDIYQALIRTCRNPAEIMHHILNAFGICLSDHSINNSVEDHLDFYLKLIDIKKPKDHPQPEPTRQPPPEPIKEPSKETPTADESYPRISLRISKNQKKVYTANESLQLEMNISNYNFSRDTKFKLEVVAQINGSISKKIYDSEIIQADIYIDIRTWDLGIGTHYVFVRLKNFYPGLPNPDLESNKINIKVEGESPGLDWNKLKNAQINSAEDLKQFLRRLYSKDWISTNPNIAILKDLINKVIDAIDRIFEHDRNFIIYKASKFYPILDYYQQQRFKVSNPEDVRIVEEFIDSGEYKRYSDTVNSTINPIKGLLHPDKLNSDIKDIFEEKYPHIISDFVDYFEKQGINVEMLRKSVLRKLDEIAFELRRRPRAAA